MWVSAISRSAPAVALPATMALMAVSTVATWPRRSAATAGAGTLVAPANELAELGDIAGQVPLGGGGLRGVVGGDPQGANDEVPDVGPPPGQEMLSWLLRSRWRPSGGRCWR